jgi:hypothetical protein
MVEPQVDRAREAYTGALLLNTLQRIFTSSMYSTRKPRDFIAEEPGREGHSWNLNDSRTDLLITAKGIPNGKA